MLACETGKATVVSNAAEKCLFCSSSSCNMPGHRINSLDPGLDKDKKIRIFITSRCAKRRRYPLYLNTFLYTATPK